MKKFIIRSGAFLLAMFTICVASNLPVFAKELKEIVGSRVPIKSASAIGAKLPIINIDVDGTGNDKIVNSKDIYKHAQMSIELGDGFEDFTSSYTTNEGNGIQIKCRGNSTYGMGDIKNSGKYSYKIKLDEKANMFGMGESKHWYLLANFYDCTNMRNKLAYDFAGALGMTYNDSIWCVVYMNGKYQGLYSMVESIRIGEGRVETFDWEEEAEDVAKAIVKKDKLNAYVQNELEDALDKDMSWITSGVFEYRSAIDGMYHTYKISDYRDTSKYDITSGYLIEFDYRYNSDTSKFRTEHDIPIEFDSPKYISTNEDMFSYVRNLFNEFETALYSQNFCDANGRHYSEFIDMQSFVDMWLVFNFTKNIEFGYYSMYLYIDNGKIVFGPCWDFDNASGNDVVLTEAWMNPEGWFNISGRAAWWKEAMSDPVFVRMCQDRWLEAREAVDVYLAQMDLYDRYIKEESLANFEKFGSPHDWENWQPIVVGYEEEYDFFASWMHQRVEWLDEQLALRDPEIEGRGPANSNRMELLLSYEHGDLLESDKITVGGAACDYIYDYTSGKNLTLTINTKHTSHRTVDVLINGKPYAQGIVCDLETPAFVDIDVSKLDIKEGDKIVINVLGHNSTSFYTGKYTTVLCTSNKNPSENEWVVHFGKNLLYVDKNDAVIEAPDVTSIPVGYSPIGWTDGRKIYKVGSSITITDNTELRVKWRQQTVYENFSVDTARNQTVTANDIDPDYVPTDLFELEIKSGIKLYGVQEKKNGRDINVRLVFLVDSLNHTSAGAVVKMNTSLGVQEFKIDTTQVYETVYGNEKSYDGNGKYFVAITLSGISSYNDVRLEVTPYIVNGSETVNGSVYTVKYTNGLFKSAVIGN